MEKHYGIAIRVTKRRDSFYTADEEMKKMMDKLAYEGGRVYYSSELSVTKARLSQLQFVIFFDYENKVFYFGEIEKTDHRKTPYKPQDYLRYYNNDPEPHKTWILLKSLFPIGEYELSHVYVYNETMSVIKDLNNNRSTSFMKKMKEPRFPRIYVYINDDYYWEFLKKRTHTTKDNQRYRFKSDILD